LRNSPRPAGAESGAVGASTALETVAVHPPSAVLSALLALVQQLTDADRARLATAL
jgi:hypothetical protein